MQTSVISFGFDDANVGVAANNLQGIVKQEVTLSNVWEGIL